MGGKVGENPAALRAAVFLLSSKNLRGGGVQTPPPPPSRARVNNIRRVGKSPASNMLPERECRDTSENDEPMNTGAPRPDGTITRTMLECFFFFLSRCAEIREHEQARAR